MDVLPRRTVGARELKTRLGRYLRAVQKGASIVVTERGEPVAELRPITPRGTKGVAARLEALSALGLVTRGTGGALAPFRPLRILGRPLSATIAEDREDRF
jgi:prevent-host-death family protein